MYSSVKLRPPTAAMVVAADTAILAAAHPGLPAWALPGFALAGALVAAVERRSACAAFAAAALVLAPATGAAYVLLLWTGYRAGYALASRAAAAFVVAAAAGGLAVQAVLHVAEPRVLPHLVWSSLVFTALPLLAGRYLAEHRRLVDSLLAERRLLAERERLRERLRIARDVHDSLGRRLSLVSVQAAALEVSGRLPPRERESTRHLAEAARGAMTELHGLVGSLRGGEAGIPEPGGVAAVERLIGEFRASGVEVSLRREGAPVELPPASGEAAYRVVEEGLTNAAKHAPGRPVVVRMAWEPDALLLTVANPAAGPPGDGPRGGHGLAGLGERARAAGGFVDHGLTEEGEFRLFAMLPAGAAVARPVRRRGWLEVAMAVAAFGALPASLLFGVRW
ncbi:sensor histidine kinase [Streptomyces hoynatensis]|uniref:histidine kinase n=1 Tax=Streptomyces hoynatensis TaxID=1141874 RepID=A0A3A9ZDZ2_9ACTN|nr:histidine kinase [Streptomyces hoynatensis]RKN46711.1 hypothetical protein D7294_00315 [Streptomyces hoynatensis]